MFTQYMKFVLIVGLLHHAHAYKAGVFEFSPSKDSGNKRDLMLKNAQEFIKQAEFARANNIDILVFPEYGLTGLINDVNPQEYAVTVPEPGSKSNEDIISRFANAADQNNVYIVINLIEKSNNSTGSSSNDSIIYYNTNIVFDKSGTIVAKYRKINLYEERYLTPGTDPVTFRADFGENFGLLTSQDILFSYPARKILDTSITSIIHPTAWKTSIPFHMPLSVQTAYAKSTGVKVLSASLNDPSQGLSGSSIVNGKGEILAKQFVGIMGSNLNTAILENGNKVDACKTTVDPFRPQSLPGGGGLSNLENLKMDRDFSDSKYKFQTLDLTDKTITESLCHSKFCCYINITVNSVANDEVYKLMVYNGQEMLGDNSTHVRYCALLACESDKDSSCANNLTPKTSFTSITISADFDLFNVSHHQPLTLNGKLEPVTDIDYCDTRSDDGTIEAKLKTQNTVSNLIAFGLYATASASTFSDYTGAVFEFTHNPDSSITPKQFMEKNIVEYEKQIEQAKTRNTDIIVFPEYGLTGLVSDPTDYAIQVPEPGILFKDEILQRLSNAARSNYMYVVVNLLEKDAGFYYSTTVVFNRAGFIVAKYRKINLYNEPKLSPGNNDRVTFTTDFGVTFGVFTSYDILFDSPGRTVLETNVTDIVYPSAWYSSLPFYMSVSVQSSYAKATGVNLLAAGINDPEKGCSGSAIVKSNGEVLSKQFGGIKGSNLIIRNIKHQPNRTDSCTTNNSSFIFQSLPGGGSLNKLENLKINKTFNDAKYTFKKLDLSQPLVTERLCHNDFCCNVKIVMSRFNDSEIYKLMVYNGKDYVGGTEKMVRYCNLLACETDSINTCGDRLSTTSIFKQISVNGNLDSRYMSHQPTTLNGQLLALSELFVCDSVFTDGSINANVETTNTESNVISFGFMATRNLDDKDQDNGAVITMYTWITLLIIIAFAILL